MDLMATSVTSKKLREADLLIYGSCIEEEEPEILKNIGRGKVPLRVCMEKEHMNKVMSKLATILTFNEPKSLTILTIDGSPHCIQLHFAAEQAENMTKSRIPIKHIVIEKGKTYEISFKALKIARHLSHVQGLLEMLKHP